MSRLWLIRHATSSAAPGVAIGASDPPLNAAGIAEARALAARLAGRPLSRIVASDLKRAVETAAVIAAPHRLAVELRAALREMDFGAWEGRELGDLWLEDPGAADAWVADIRSTPSSFGESLDDLHRRVRAFWSELQPLPSKGELAIVGHRGSLAVLRAVITSEPISDTMALPFPPATAVALEAVAV